MVVGVVRYMQLVIKTGFGPKTLRFKLLSQFEPFNARKVAVCIVIEYSSNLVSFVTISYFDLTRPRNKGGTYREKATGVCCRKDPFSRSFSHSRRPPFQHFSVPQDPHYNHFLFKIFVFKMLNVVTFQFLNLIIDQNPVLEASFGP